MKKVPVPAPDGEDVGYSAVWLEKIGRGAIFRNASQKGIFIMSAPSEAGIYKLDNPARTKTSRSVRNGTAGIVR